MTRSLNVGHLKDANDVQRELMELVLVIKFTKPKSSIVETYVCSFIDTSFNISRTHNYGKSGLLTGQLIRSNDRNVIYHIIDWSSSKQKRVCHSSYGVEVLTCSDADDRGYHFTQSLHCLFPSLSITHKLHVDSRALYDTITTLNEGKDYRVRQALERIRDSFESCEFDTLRWVPGVLNIADALTKRNTALFRTLNEICLSGMLIIDLDQGCELKNRTWK